MRKFFRRIVIRWKLEIIKMQFRDLEYDHDMYHIINYETYKQEAEALIHERRILQEELDSL